MPDKVNIAEKLALINDHWNPRIAGEFQGMHVRLVKLLGEFVWHHHDNEDELFVVIKGRLLLKFRDKDVWVEPGEFIVVPRGVEHMPVAPEEVEVMLIEPAGTVNTGNVEDSDRTRTNLQHL
jgi:mannose-6-phosphate isomerase-like protein (cupin superfamily)